MGKRDFAALAILAVAAAAAACAESDRGSAERAAGGLLEFPVQFSLLHTNTSGAPCPATDGPIELRGTFVGPQGAVRRPGDKAVSLYLYGLDASAAHWRFQAVAGYDHAVQMARLGHISVTVAMAGLDGHRFADGHQDCFGAQADLAHQIVQHLRSGTYTIESGEPIAFSSVVLVGHDVAGMIVEIEAYSYKDVAGLVNIVWVDRQEAVTPFARELFAKAVQICAAGGESADAGGKTGYVRFDPPDDQFRQMLFHDAEHEVIEATVRLIQNDPCGWLEHLASARTVNQARLAEIAVPVLLMYPDHDPIFTRDGQARQQDYFLGSDDVTTVVLEGTGHIPMLERTAPQFREILSAWLVTRGFGGS